MALLDDVMYDGGHIKDEDKIGVERGESGSCNSVERQVAGLTVVMNPIKVRLEALRRKLVVEPVAPRGRRVAS